MDGFPAGGPTTCENPSGDAANLPAPNVAPLRLTRQSYARRDDGSAYLVDRLAHRAVFTPPLSTSAATMVALTEYFYDGQTGYAGIGTRGLLTLERVYYDAPQPSVLHSRDTVYGYDAWGNRTTVTTYTGAGTRSQSDPPTYTGPDGTARTTTTVYDPTVHVFPIQQINPLGHIVKADYDYQLGTLLRVTGPNSSGGAVTNCDPAVAYSIPATEETTCAVYDVFGRMVKLVKPGDSRDAPTRVVVYDDWAQPVSIEIASRHAPDASGDGQHEAFWFYDGLGRKIQAKRESAGYGGQWIVTDWRYDGLGRVVAESQPRYDTSAAASYIAPGGTLFRGTTTSYDMRGRVTQVTQPDGTTTTTGYYPGTLGTIVTVYDAKNHATERRFDLFDRLHQVVEYSGNNGSEGPWAVATSTNYGYDQLDRLTGVTDAKGNVTSIQYDSLGRKKQMTDPDMGGWSYVYNPAGTLQTQTDAAGRVTSFTYDALDRMRTQTIAGGQVANYTYDEATYNGTVINGIGRRTSTSTTLNGASQSYMRWEYDARGRETLAGTSVTGYGTHHIMTGYDSADRVTSLNYY